MRREVSAFGRSFVTLATVLGVTLAPLRASATELQACLTASEKGQHARAAGKLREAREQLMICGGEGCPALVRRDCSQWQAEIAAITPTVVFGAKDKQGRDLFDVAVAMDGEPLVKKLDGKSVVVDPGPHTFTFEMRGHPAIIERALVKEGEKTRAIAVTFGAEAAAPTPIAPAPPEDRVQTGDSGHTVFPWIVVGVGVATVITGTTLLLTAPDLPDGCAKSSRLCARTPGESDESFSSRQDQAGQSEGQPRLGWIVGAVGLGIVAGGLLWHFLEPTGPRTSGLRVSPWAGPGTSGAAVSGAF
jgi:hypothetical protein